MSAKRLAVLVVPVLVLVSSACAQVESSFPSRRGELSSARRRSAIRLRAI